ncbi:MAG: hypothetical protein M1838_005099 [Thelocarpon superellum]|nr:MAG: hypothetical protein M1838_005099 [Thelocarpon superellum]
MGNDGGSIPTRRELVKEAARNPNGATVKETQQEKLGWSWKHCPLSHRPLQRPVVSDASGKLYNKDAVLELLLPGDEGDDHRAGMSKVDAEEVLAGRVKSLKDVVEVRFECEMEEEEVVADRREEKGVLSNGIRKVERWVCPVTRKRLGPAVKAVYLVPCGHVFSESAIREISGDTCLQVWMTDVDYIALRSNCDASYTADNIIPILPVTPSDLDFLASRAQKLKEQGLTHSLKKAQGSSKKRKKHAEAATAAVDADPAATLSTGEKQSDARLVAAIANSTPTSTTGGIKNAATASLTAKVLQDEEERKKRQKLGMNRNLKGLFSNGSNGAAVSGSGKSGNGDFMNRGFTIPAGARR